MCTNPTKVTKNCSICESKPPRILIFPGRKPIQIGKKAKIQLENEFDYPFKTSVDNTTDF